jgi:hypothetical protein
MITWREGERNSALYFISSFFVFLIASIKLGISLFGVLNIALKYIV